MDARYQIDARHVRSSRGRTAKSPFLSGARSLAIPVIAGNPGLFGLDGPRDLREVLTSIEKMLRREFLAGLAAAPVLTAKTRIDRGRISFILPTEAAATRRCDPVREKYSLRWVELRDVPGGGGHYMRQSDEKLKEAARQFQDNGIKVSFLTHRC